MNKIITMLAILVLMTGIASAQSENSKSLINPFSTVENFVEDAEVQLAGVIGGPDLKAKALANNAEEALQEAEKLAERNRSEAAVNKIEKYEKNLNKSQKLLDEGENRELKDKVQNLSNQNIQRLEEVKKKVPKEAQKGIEKAINNSKRRGELPAKEKTPRNNAGRPENLSKNTPANKTEKPGKKVDRNLSNLEDKPERNKTGLKPEKGENTTDNRKNLSEKNGKSDQEIENGTDSAEDSTNDTSESVENPVEDNNSQPSLGR